MKLTAVFEPAKEGGYTCFVEEIPAAISQGETVEETKANLLDALKLVCHSWLLPSQANPASAGPCAVKADANPTARTDPINEQGGCTTGLGHRAFDQLVVVDQILPINDRITDLDHGERVFVISGLINRYRGVGR